MPPSDAGDATTTANLADAGGYRTYEVFQRERVGETTNLLSPRQLISRDYQRDPYPILAIMRENYPCYRDWVSNRFWITRYDDVTSVFVDDANFETRPKAWWLGHPDANVAGGSALAADVAIRSAWTEACDASIATIIERLVAPIAELLVEPEPEAVYDIARHICARLPLELLGDAFGFEGEDRGAFARAWLAMHQGAGWIETHRTSGCEAYDDMTALLERSTMPGLLGDAFREFGASPIEMAAALLEFDHETLHGSLANLWFLLLTNPEQLAVVCDQPRLMKFAYLEALRHSPPVLSAARFSRHEVERFGRLLPQGALLWCSAAAANRDPRQFSDPDEFIVERTDLCQREPRGQYRADGLAAGIAFGHGKPSRLPATPKQGPRSAYALTRDLAVQVSMALLDRLPLTTFAEGVEPTLRSLRLGDMHTCWQLPVTLATL